MTAKVALMITDVAPTRELAESLARSGYYIEFAYSSEAALARVNLRVPTLAVVGPLLRAGEAVNELLTKLGQLRVHTVVISREPAIVETADRLGMQVRDPES
jgi:ActR/RegA family two-component response regulator